MRRGAWIALGSAWLALVIPRQAAADQAGDLYQAGLDAMLANNYTKGCPKLQQSYDLDPLPGALFTLAACYERWGKLHSAVERYERFLADQGTRSIAKLPADQRKKAEERMATALEKVRALGPQVPTLTFELSSPGVATEVRVDDVEVALGTPVKLDPGEHKIVWTADGPPKERSATIAAGAHDTMTLEVPAPPVVAPPSVAEPDESDDGVRTGMFIGSIVALGVGVAGVVVGSVTGVLVFSKKEDADALCEGNVCTSAGKEAVDDGKRLGLISTIGFVAGGVGIAGAALLFFLAPDAASEGDDVAIHIGAGDSGASFAVGGTF